MSNYSTFYVLDLDRTILNTIRTAELMADAAAMYDKGLAEKLARTIAEYSERGESLSMRVFVEDAVGEAAAGEIEAYFLELASKESILNPGAEELIEYIDSLHDAGQGILTYGSPKGQMIKVQAARLDMKSVLVTPNPTKGPLLDSWRQKDGKYELPAEFGGKAADKIVFVDDKAIAFKDMPSDIRGYWLQDKYMDGAGDLGENVTPVKSLFEVIETERRLARN